MKRWWVVMALMLSIGVNVGIVVARFVPRSDSAPVERPGPEPGPGPDGGELALVPPREQLPRVIRRMAQEMGLSEDERSEFFALQRRFLTETVENRRRVMTLQGQLRREVTAEEPDREAIGAILEEVGTAHVAMETTFIDNLLAVRELLDPAQERVYMRFLQQMRRGGDDRRGPPGRRPGDRFPPGPRPRERQPPREGPPGGGGGE